MAQEESAFCYPLMFLYPFLPLYFVVWSNVEKRWDSETDFVWWQTQNLKEYLLIPFNAAQMILISNCDVEYVNYFIDASQQGMSTGN